MSTQRITAGTVQFDTSSPTFAATTTTLNGAIDNVQTSITIVAHDVVTGTYIRILAEGGHTTEFVLVTGGGGAGVTALTVARAQLGTAADAHSNGATVDVPGW
ncbi:MAG TPA: hypothetical protein VNH83_21350, partial [Bryobacteraceae bacterium]|nr:hypothetical protein [Bryobacteraceae bacterium]